MPQPNSSTTDFCASSVLEDVRAVMRMEAAAIDRICEKTGRSTSAAIEMIWESQGRLIVTGMGKMGWIARKAAATFSSTGTPALYLHPGEAAHGDLGIVTADDLVLALSNSGETDELNALLPFLHRWNVPVVSITGNPESTLAAQSTIVLDGHVDSEADENCPAPTCSTTAALALCDAMAIALMRLRGFDHAQFATFHPGGQIGRRLLITVKDVMIVPPKVPVVETATTLKQAIVEMSNRSLGCTLVVDSNRVLCGILTDGDLRRIFQASSTPLEDSVGQFMTESPASIKAEQLAVDALQIMQSKSITVLPVVDADNQIIGILHMHDLMRARLV